MWAYYVVPISGNTNNSSNNSAISNAFGNFMKYFLFISNLLVLITALGLFLIGYQMYIDKNYIVTLFEVNVIYIYSETETVYMILGSLFCVIAFLGCWGSIKEDQRCLKIYAIALTVVTVAILTGVSFIYIHRSRAIEITENSAVNEIKRAKSDEFLTKKWDEVQITWKCCGAKSPNDWSGNWPVSCCGKTPQSPCYFDTDGFNKTPCLPILYNFLKQKLYSSVSLGTFFLALFIIQITFAFSLANRF